MKHIPPIRAGGGLEFKFMKKHFCYATLFFILLSQITSVAVAEQTYSIGVVPQFDTRRTAKIWQPILDEVSRKSGIKLELKSSPNILEFESQFKAGVFDFAYMNPYHAIIANEKQGYSPLLRDNGRNLFGIIVVKKDSPILSVTELDNETIAFPSQNALGATLLPRAELNRKFNIKVNGLYVKSHSSVYLNVLLGKTIAGGGVQKTLSIQPEKIRDNLRILYETSAVSSHPLTVHSRVDMSVIHRVRTAFLELGDSESGRALLKKIPMKKIGPASIDDYQSLKEMGLDKYYAAE